jgi:hypothetical protein
MVGAPPLHSLAILAPLRTEDLAMIDLVEDVLAPGGCTFQSLL